MTMLDRRAFIGGATAFGAFGGTRLFAAPTGAFSDGEPNLRFGVLSDLHIRVTKGERGYGFYPGYCGGPEVFEHALGYFRDRKVDAVMIAGDMSDLGIGDELVLVGRTWDKVFPNGRAPDGRKVERLFITGNHESGAYINPPFLKDIRNLYQGDDAEVRRQILRTDFAPWWEKAFHEPYERFYHRNVKGYDFLCANWDDGTRLTPDMRLDGMSWSFASEDFGIPLKAWLDAHGKDLDPRRPFFYQQHRNLWKTTYANWGWNHDNGRATNVLSAYPNAATFSGDTHFSLTDERSIWQGSFTALGTASLRYSGMPYDSRGQASFENTDARYRYRAKFDPRKTMAHYDPVDCKQGMVVSVYDDRMVFERRDFLLDLPLGDDWVVPLGADRPFAFATRAKKAKAPQFAPDAKLSVRRVKGRTRGGTEKDAVEIVIPPAVQSAQSRCHEYAVTAVGKGRKTRAEFYVLAEGFDCPPAHKRTQRPTVFSVALDRLPANTVRFEVCPMDCWWNRGTPLLCNF